MFAFASVPFPFYFRPSPYVAIEKDRVSPCTLEKKIYHQMVACFHIYISPPSEVNDSMQRTFPPPCFIWRINRSFDLFWLLFYGGNSDEIHPLAQLPIRHCVDGVELFHPALLVDIGVFLIFYYYKQYCGEYLWVLFKWLFFFNLMEVKCVWSDSL